MSTLCYKVYEDNLMLDFAQYCNIQICKHNNKLNKAQNTKQNKSAHTKKKIPVVLANCSRAWGLL